MKKLQLKNIERITVINDRLSAGYKLLKKHSLTTTEQLLKLMQDLQNKLDGYADISSSIDTLLGQYSEIVEDVLEITDAPPIEPVKKANKKKSVNIAV